MVFSVTVLINETTEINCTPDVAKNPSNSQRNPNKLVYKLCIMKWNDMQNKDGASSVQFIEYFIKPPIFLV